VRNHFAVSLSGDGFLRLSLRSCAGELDTSDPESFGKV